MSKKNKKYNISSDSIETVNTSEDRDITERMIRFLEDKGFEVTPSGNPKNGFLKKAINPITNSFYVSRGVIRKAKESITDSINSLKEAGV